MSANPQPAARTEASGTAGAWLGVLLGVLGIALAVVLTMIGFSLPFESSGADVLYGLSGLSAVVSLFVGNANLQRLRVRRLAAAMGPHRWAGVCVAADQPRRIRALVVTDQAVHLTSMRRKPLVTVPRAALTDARGISTQIGARNHPVLYLGSAETPAMTLGFPTAYGVGFSGKAVGELVTLLQPAREPHG